MELYVQEIKGEPLPKQYVNLIGRRSMLEHTFNRTEKLIPAEQILTVVDRGHLLRADVCRQLASRPRETLIVQPAHKETEPGILLPLMFIYKRCPQAIVAVFPSDHFVLEENRFMNHVKLAVQAARQNPSRIVLLAIEPHEPETEYGYVVPHEDVGKLGRFGTRGVSAFIEKSTTELAARLMLAGGLWNTMIMVFSVDTLLQLIRCIHPVIYRDFTRILEALGTRREQATIDEVYENLEPANFSRHIMERIAIEYPTSISVLPVRAVFWSDLGSRERVLRVHRRLHQLQSEEIETVIVYMCMSRERERQRACRFDLNRTLSSGIGGRAHRPNVTRFRFRCQRNGADRLAVANRLAHRFRAGRESKRGCTPS